MDYAYSGYWLWHIGARFCTHLAHQHHDVRVFEKSGRIGGHAHTRTITTDIGKIAVDTGFIVYNELNYPNLKGLFAHMGVETIASDMSLSGSGR